MAPAKTARALIAAAVGAAASSSPVFALANAEAAPSFDEYCEHHGKSYSGEEYERRKAFFDTRADQIQQLNARPGATWTAGFGHMTDQTPEELRSRFGYVRTGGADGKGGDMTSALASAGMQGFGTVPEGDVLPAEVDWRMKSPSVVTAVKNQGECGSCWAFAAVQAIETHVALSTGLLMDLSPQQITSCTPNPGHCGGTGGCDGATAELAFDYTIDHGLATSWSAPYISGLTRDSGECLSSWMYPSAATISGYEKLPMNDAQALMSVVATKGPVVVAVDATHWVLYQKGIFDGCNKTNPIVNHAVTLMGYGEEAGTKYWLVRNTWGAMFGEAGYIRLRRYADDEGGEPCGVDTDPQQGQWCEDGPSEVRVCGECGILSDSSYPTGAGLSTPSWRRRLDSPETPDVHV